MMSLPLIWELWQPLHQASGIKINPSTVFFGEVGLTGEVRSVSQMDKRITESLRLGFQRCIVPGLNKSIVSDYKNEIEIVMVSTVEQALSETLS